jgi:hypothetical protein
MIPYVYYYGIRSQNLSIFLRMKLSSVGWGACEERTCKTRTGTATDRPKASLHHPIRSDVVEAGAGRSS